MNARDSVHFRWDVGERAGTWTITTDASPTSHDIDLYGRDDRGSSWDDDDRSYDGDERIDVDVLAGGHIHIRVMNYDGGAPTDLTLSIEAPAAVDPPVSDLTDTPTATATSTHTATATDTPTPTATATPDEFTSSGSGTGSDPYIVSDPSSISAHSIRSYVAELNASQSVYFRWDVGDRRRRVDHHNRRIAERSRLRLIRQG